MRIPIDTVTAVGYGLTNTCFDAELVQEGDCSSGKTGIGIQTNAESDLTTGAPGQPWVFFFELLDPGQFLEENFSAPLTEGAASAEGSPAALPAPPASA